MTQDNSIADLWIQSAQVTKTTHFHYLTHTNMCGLRSRLSITNKQAHHKLQTYPTCQNLHTPQTCPKKVNPQGLVPNNI